MKIEKIKIKCISKYPFVEVPGIGKTKPGDIVEIRKDMADCLILCDDWELVYKPKPVTATKKKEGEK